MNKMTIKQKMLIGTGLVLLAFGVVSVSCLNPFGLREIDWDSSAYLTIARGITRGQVPFRDFFDNKGPLTYLTSAPGMALGGFTGVWFTELLFMCVSVFFAYKAARFFAGKYAAFLGVVCGFIIFQACHFEAAGIEEYTLPFMMISLFIFTKYYVTQKEPPVYELITLGICFAATVFFRINMFPLWLGFCFVIVIELLWKARWILVLRYTLFFIVGILIVSIPVFLYLIRNNAFADYVNHNFLSGSARAFTGFSVKEFVKTFFAIMYKKFCFIPLVASFLWIAKKRKNISVVFSFGFLLSYFLTIFFFAVIRTPFDQYNTAFTPFLVLSFSFFIQAASMYFSDSKHKNIVLLFFLFLVFSNEIVLWFYSGYISMAGKDTSRSESIAAGKTIDQWTEPGDTIISLGFPCRIYLFTERQSASRFIYQTTGAVYVPGMWEEFLSDMETNKPKIIAIPNREGRYDWLPDWYAPVFNLIERDYRLLSDDNGYMLFLRKCSG